MNWFSYLFWFALLAGMLLDYWLLLRQRRHVGAHRKEVPQRFQQEISLDQHQRAADYTLAKLGATAAELPWGMVILLGWIGGGVEWLNRWLEDFMLDPLSQGVMLILLVLLISTLLELPFSLYRTFVLEARFGFNRTTPGRYALDLLLQFALTIVIGGALVWVILWVMMQLGAWWWVAGWLVWTAFMLLMMWLFPTVIAPLFNKFEPLADEDLKHRIQALLDRCGFRSKGVFVMDGSRRSSHGNAYFTGFGAAKRIVFFDTLIETLKSEETEAVLAHELGHYKHKHVRKMLAFSVFSTFIGFWLIGWTMLQPWFYEGLGVESSNQAMDLVLIALVLPLFSRFLQPLISLYQRRHEFEADDFAAQQTGTQPLVGALVKLYRDNASTLTPDPIYSAFHDSHPPAPVRIAHLERAE